MTIRSRKRSLVATLEEDEMGVETLPISELLQEDATRVTLVTQQGDQTIGLQSSVGAEDGGEEEEEAVGEEEVVAEDEAEVGAEVATVLVSTETMMRNCWIKTKSMMKEVLTIRRLT
jgi:hypothetical protein